MKLGKDVVLRTQQYRKQIRKIMNTEYLKKLGGKVPTKLVGQGMPASIGLSTIVTGKVRIVKTPKEAEELVKEGDILVTEMTNPDFVPVMKRASAIVTEKGGISSHTAVVARELRIPAVVGVKGAMSRLQNGRLYYIDVRRGKIYEI